MLKVIGAGLTRTGTHSLRSALEMLGLKAIHFDTQRLNDVLDGSDRAPDFRRYDDVDAVCDLPTAAFFNELMDAYPGSKVILTVRDQNGWWESVEEHFTRNPVGNEERLLFRLYRKFGIPLREPEIDTFRRHLRQHVYGSATPQEFLYKKRFSEHNELVLATVPSERLLVMDITAGDGWEKLCPFIGAQAPDKPFPHEGAPTPAANDHRPGMFSRAAIF